MLTGEFEYEELIPVKETIVNATSEHSAKETFTNEAIDTNVVYNHFPGISHITLLLFIISVPIVMMNLLVAIAVSDVSKLAKTAKRTQLLSQVELIIYIKGLMKFWVFKNLLPLKVQAMVNNKVLSGDTGFNP